MDVAHKLCMFCRAVWPILLVVIYSSGNKELKCFWWNPVCPDGKQTSDLIIFSVVKKFKYYQS